MLLAAILLVYIWKILSCLTSCCCFFNKSYKYILCCSPAWSIKLDKKTWNDRGSFLHHINLWKRIMLLICFHAALRITLIFLISCVCLIYQKFFIFEHKIPSKKILVSTFDVDVAHSFHCNLWKWLHGMLKLQTESEENILAKFRLPLPSCPC